MSQPNGLGQPFGQPSQSGQPQGQGEPQPQQFSASAQSQQAYQQPPQPGFNNSQNPQMPPMYSGPSAQMPSQQQPGNTDPGIDNAWYGIGFGAAIKRYWQKYVRFDGRASRGEYWWMVLFNGITSFVLESLLLIGIDWGAYLASLRGACVTVSYAGSYSVSCHLPIIYSFLTGFGVFIMVLMGLWSLANLLPGLGLMVRRLHDVNKAWTWIFIILIPIAGPIWFIVILATKSYPYLNRWNFPAGYQPQYPPYPQQQNQNGYPPYGGYSQI
jgi:uncharacterized membrane protein YhaH (DUF805 family)